MYKGYLGKGSRGIQNVQEEGDELPLGQTYKGSLFSVPSAKPPTASDVERLREHREESVEPLPRQTYRGGLFSVSPTEASNTMDVERPDRHQDEGVGSPPAQTYKGGLFSAPPMYGLMSDTVDPDEHQKETYNFPSGQRYRGGLFGAAIPKSPPKHPHGKKVTISPKNSIVPDISKGLGRNQEKRDISQLEQFVVDNLPLMMYEEKLYLYEPPHWRNLNEREAKKEIRTFLEKECQIGYLTASDYRKIRDLLVINPDISEERKLTSPGGKVNMLDGTYDLQTGELLPHDPKDYFFSCINVHGQKMDTCRGDTFEAFVQNCSDGDPMVRKQLLQLVALTILGKPFKHFFVLLGESNTGKTQFGRFLEELVGRKYVGSVRGAHDFGDRWTVGSLAGKLLGVCLDLPNGPFPAAAIGTIKQMTGDDPVKVEEKYLAPSTCYEKPLLLFAGNHPIQIPRMEEEQALLNRMIVIPFRNPVQEADMKQELYKDLLKEAPYIVREAFAEYRELEWNNFQLARSELPPELMPYNSRAGYRSVGRFLEQECELCEKAETRTQALYDAYRISLESSEYQLSLTEFSRQLSENLERCSEVSPVKRVSGTGSRGYRGIRLKQDRPEDIDPPS